MKVPITSYTIPLDILKLFFSEEMLDYVVAKTNAYANKRLQSITWKDLTKNEILKFMGICLCLKSKCYLSGIILERRESINVFFYHKQ